MPATVPPFGWRIPEPADPPDGPQAFLELATDIADTFDARPIWLIAANISLSFINGTATLTFGQANVPAGYRFVANPAVLIQHRSNTFPSTRDVFAVGSITTTGCVVHGWRNESPLGSGTVAVSALIAGRIERGAWPTAGATRPAPLPELDDDTAELALPGGE